jgi:hypothetical protein
MIHFHIEGRKKRQDGKNGRSDGKAFSNGCCCVSNGIQFVGDITNLFSKP